MFLLSLFILNWCGLIGFVIVFEVFYVEVSVKCGWCFMYSECVGGLYYFVLVNWLIDGCNDCRLMWWVVVRVLVLVLVRLSSCIWIVLIWWVRLVGLKFLIWVVMVESCCVLRMFDVCRCCYGVVGLL